MAVSKDTDNFDIPALRAQFMTLLGSQASIYPANIETAFPRILAKLIELWGSEALEPYIDSLIFSDRPDRHGFPPAVATELFGLSTAHAGFNRTPKPKTTAWEDSDSADLIVRTAKRHSRGH